MSEPSGEFAYINWIRSQLPAADPNVSIGAGDDMAEVRLPGDAGRVLVGTDTILDGVHFDSTAHDLADVGWKALAVNLSDVAAMGATPLAAVGTLAMPHGFTTDAARRLFEGLRRCAGQFECSWVGGDVTAWDHPLAITVTVLAHADEPVRRGGARPGQVICVTGSLGGSIAGRHLTFTPRVLESRLLVRAARPGAMIDLSDGLSSDLGHICDESGVGAAVDAAAVPISDAARELAKGDGRAPLDHALNDGEDFELLFTVDEPLFGAVAQASIGVPVTAIGRITDAAAGRVLLDEQGGATPLEPGGYEHWR